MTEPKAAPRGTVLPVHAKADEIVEIHWHLPEGDLIQQHTRPPKATAEVRIQEQKDNHVIPVERVGRYGKK